MEHTLVKQMSLAVCLLLVGPGSLDAEVQDPGGIKRAFLDRYLACAEAPGDRARLECYDALLLDIPAWLDEAHDSARHPASPRVDQPVQASERRDGCGHIRSTD